MRRILIAAAVAAGMTMATSSAMAQGGFYSSSRGIVDSSAIVQVGRRPVYRGGYYRSPRYYRGGNYYRVPSYYRGRGYYRGPTYYRGRSYYRSPYYYGGRGYYNRSGFRVRTPGFSFGIGF